MQRFAIVGAASEERNDAKHPFPFSPLVDVAKSREAARLIGVALAKKRCGLIVYDARFIEGGTSIHYLEQKLAEKGEVKK